MSPSSASASGEDSHQPEKRPVSRMVRGRNGPLATCIVVPTIAPPVAVQAPVPAPVVTPPPPKPVAKPAPPAALPPVHPHVPAPVAAATPPRWGWVSFAALVLAPLALAAWYLFARAEDQWASHLSFAVEQGQPGLSASMLEGVPGLEAFAGNPSTETALLRDYLTSQALVARIDARLDLRALWQTERDPVFGFEGSGTVEDLTRYWPRMVHIRDDPSSGILSLRVQAFAPEQARAIAEAIHVESAAMVNALSEQSRDEALKFAAQELALAEARLSDARTRLAVFRNETGLVDPEAEMLTETGVLGALQQQLAEALVEQGMLDTSAQSASARPNAMTRAKSHEAARRIEVLRAQIATERAAVGSGENRDYSAQLAQYERHVTDLEFARALYLGARATYEAARGEATRQGFYLASFAAPSVAERALYPRRWLILGLGAVFLALIWSVLALGVTALRDRA